MLEPILGHATHARNLQRLVPGMPGIEPEFYFVPFAVSERAARVPVFRSNWSVRSGIRARRAIRAMHRRRPLDGLFVHTQVPAVLVPDWLRRIPSVVSIDATPAQLDELGAQYEHTVSGSMIEAAKRRANVLCFGEASHVVAWSEWAAAGLTRDYSVAEGKISVVAPGVDLDTWRRPDGSRRPDDGVVRLLFVGGDADRKGGRLLVEAFRQVRESRPAASIELHLVTGAEIAPADGVVVHHGLTPNDTRLIELYHRADVFCLPTYGDCLPMVLAEAGAAALPLVSTPVGAIPEIVQPDRSGMLVPPGDGRALVAALGLLVDDPDRRHRLGEGAASIVAEHHDATRNAGELVGIISQTIAEARP